MSNREDTADEIAEVRSINREIWNLDEREAKRAELIMRLRATSIRLDEVHRNSQRVLAEAIGSLTQDHDPAEDILRSAYFDHFTDLLGKPPTIEDWYRFKALMTQPKGIAV